MKSPVLVFLLLFFSPFGFAQLQEGKDSVVKDSGQTLPANQQIRDSVAVRDSTQKDSVEKLLPPPIIRFDTAVFSAPGFYQIKDPIRLIISPRVQESKDVFFYILVTLVLFFAVLRNSFNRYIKDLMRLFFRTTIKQRQIKEQMMQDPLPSLLLNLLFLLSGSFFINLLLQYYGLGRHYNFWWLLLYGMVGLALIYFVKFVTLKICGWLFRLSDATDAYIFIVFSTNKVIGIALLPMVILLAFAEGEFFQVALNLSFLLIGMLFLYRFYLSYVSIHRQVKVQVFHFALYLCAFELIPLLLINKLLFQFLSINA